MINEGMGFFCMARLISSCAFASFSLIGFCSVCVNMSAWHLYLFLYFFFVSFLRAYGQAGLFFLSGSGG